VVNLGELILWIAMGVALMGGLYGLTRLAPPVLAFLTKRSALRFPSLPIPESWAAIVGKNVPLSRHLDVAGRERLLTLTQLLLSEVPMEGCDGLEVTDEMRVTIAATACLLLLNLPYPRFHALKRILIYPDTFIPAYSPSRHARGVETVPEPTLGEA
jgi:Mlc titration factor MtfA (ptsG expression regulator)